MRWLLRAVFAVWISPAFAAQITVDGATIAEAGIYTADTKSTDPNQAAVAGQSSILENIVLVKKTTSIPLKDGLLFGIWYTIDGKPDGAEVYVDAVWKWPQGGMPDKNGKPATREKVPTKVTIGGRYFTGYFIGRGSPVGTWIREIWYKGRRLAEIRFEVGTGAGQ